MTRLVVHVGTHATDWSTVQRQLVSWRSALAAGGVHMLPADDPGAWSGALNQLAEGLSPDVVDQAAQAANHDDADMLLLSSERLEDAVRDATSVATIEEFARDHGMPLTVAIVVRDQIGYLNELYGDRITHLQMARDFSSFVDDPQPHGRFDYDTAFAALLDAPGIEVVAVPYADLVDGRQAAALLSAVGAPVDLDSLPSGDLRPTMPGAVEIAATRLLYKRMWRMGMFKNLPRPLLLEAAGTLRAHAADALWDDTAFWGWTAEEREAAIERYRPGNDAFAAKMWGHPWDPAEWADGEHTDVDVAASSPELVVDLIQTVDRIIRELQEAKTTLTSSTAAS